MENEAREHLNLAHYNFNRMAVIDEEGIDTNNARRAVMNGERGGTRGNDQLMSAGQDRRQKNNMHNTASSFY